MPVFEVLESVTPDTYAVIEMSSHQLEFTHVSPEVAILTNIYEEHLDHYKGGFTGYVNAKLHIMNYQNENDTFIYNADQGVSEYVKLNSTRAEKIGVSVNDPLPFEVRNEHLLGVHNKQDVIFAYRAAKAFGVSDTVCEKGVENFSGIEHRMERSAHLRALPFIMTA